MTSPRTSGPSGPEVFPLALGSDVFGRTADQEQSFAVLDVCTAAGGDFVDAAYSCPAWTGGTRAASPRRSSVGGPCSKSLGRVKARGDRSDAVVATVAPARLAAQPTVAAPIASARTVRQLPALLGSRSRG